MRLANILLLISGVIPQKISRYPIRYLRSSIFLKNNPSCELLLENIESAKYRLKDYENCIASECSFYSDLTIQVIDWKLANDECGYEEYEDPYLRIGSGRQRIVDVIDSERLL